MPDRADIASATHLAVVTLPLHSMVESVPIIIADKVMTETNNMYTYLPLIETLLNYEKVVWATRMESQRYEEDRSAHINVSDPTCANARFVAR